MISLIKIDKDNFQHFKDDILEIEKASFPSPWSVHAFREEIERPVSSLWGLVTDNKLVGYICFWEFAGEIHLMNIAVHPDRRRSGLGQHMLNRMIEAGISKGFQTAWLEVRPSNLKARRLYKKTCFRETGRRPQYYKDTHEDAIVMSLQNLSDLSGRQAETGNTLYSQS
jgi:ribosomal-protein-alanine N-acetyltransferase